MIGVVVVHYGDSSMTIACIDALYRNAGMPFELVVVDNSGEEQARNALRKQQALHGHFALISNPRNNGFAGACNQAFNLLLDRPGLEAVALLNNDAIVECDWLINMYRWAFSGAGADMVASRLMRDDNRHQVDSLGIVLYKSGIAANRMSEQEPLLGPCGGSAFYSARLLRTLRAADGSVFDPEFFCYAEDTDLALRARAAGFACAYADNAIAYHKGSAASGGAANEFVAYHGLRNSLFAIIKNLPPGFLVRNAFWLCAMQVLVSVKYVLKGKPGLLWRVYRDVAQGWPRVVSQRAQLRLAEPRYLHEWRHFVSRRFYDHGYMINTLGALHRRDITPSLVPPRN